MLYFSKLKIISVVIFTLLLSYFSLSNFTKIDDDFFKKNINLGLDLQGGSYLLLEIDNSPVLEQQIQNKYDAFFIDLWGVIHDGVKVYPEAIDVLTNLNKLNKRFVLISNAPRPSKSVER